MRSLRFAILLLAAAPGAQAIEARLLDAPLSIDQDWRRPALLDVASPIGGDTAGQSWLFEGMSGMGAAVAHLYAALYLPLLFALGATGYNFSIGDWTGLYFDLSVVGESGLILLMLASLLSMPAGTGYMINTIAESYGKSTSWWTVGLGYLPFAMVLVGTILYDQSQGPDSDHALEAIILVGAPLVVATQVLVVEF